MRMDLAAEVYMLAQLYGVWKSCKVYHLCVSQQVLSKIISEALSFYAIPGSAAIQTFLIFVDWFFDMLNVRHPDEFARKRKEEFKLYTSPDDDRLKVHMYTFVSTNTHVYTWTALYQTTNNQECL